jgi:glycosyltransferase involved in cell wall biosynthesis
MTASAEATLSRIAPPTTASRADADQPRIAVLIPCYNEEATVARVAMDFQAALPGATIYVYDNNSRDRTAEQASAAGAVVRQERLQGKGHVVRRMFADIEADIYVMVDGDATYEAASAPRLIERLRREGLDMVVGSRVEQQQAAYRPGHRFGNRLLTGTVARLFGQPLEDMLSGYRVFSRRFAKTFPAVAGGFEIETELTVHALELNMAIAEVATAYGARPEGSISKLSTYRDGMRILWMILRLFKNERPLSFFSILFCLMAALSLVLAAPVIVTWLETGLVPRFPTAILSTGLMLLAFQSLTCGFILDTVTHGRREAKRLAYLAFKAPFELHE